MKCLGTVLLAIATVGAVFSGLITVAFALLWLAHQSAVACGLGGTWAELAFQLGYIAIFIGTGFGVSICMDARK